MKYYYIEKMKLRNKDENIVMSKQNNQNKTNISDFKFV